MGFLFHRFNPRRLPCARLVAVTLLLIGAALLAAQPENYASMQEQRAAMQKLAFLIGRWAGPVTIQRGQAGPIHLTKTEDGAYKLDGLVMLIQGTGTGANGKTQFEALATIAYDEPSHAFHIRAYNGGHYVDTVFTVQSKGFSWEFASGPAHIVNSMHWTPSGDWQETSGVSLPNRPPFPSVQMLLHRIP